MFNQFSKIKNSYKLTGKYETEGYDWWWHSFSAINKLTKKEKSFYIQYFIINPGLNKDKIVLGQSKQSKFFGNKPSYLMVNVGAREEGKKQLHRFFPLKDVFIDKNSLQIKAGDCELSETHIKGSVCVKENIDGDMSDLGEMCWDLNVKKQIAWNVGYGTSKIFCKLKAFEMYWHAEGMKTLFSGTITLDGIEYEVKEDSCYGYSDKNWGSNFTTPWLWLSSNHIIDNKTNKKLLNSAFVIGGGKPKIFGVSLPRKLLAGYYIEGTEYEMNFSKFVSHRCKTEFSFDDSDKNWAYWKVTQTDKKFKIVTEVKCWKKDMLFINYENPKGEKPFSHLYNGGNGTGTLKIYDLKTNEIIHDLTILNVGCEYGEWDKK